MASECAVHRAEPSGSADCHALDGVATRMKPGRRSACASRLAERGERRDVTR
jgi:hypothetical protein